MGKFDGYLICSDFDGTIYIDQQISKKNIEAIEYFQSEGGYFTFASGRNYEMFATGAANVITPNAPILAYNGAFIVSLDGKKTFYQGEVSKEQMLHAFTAYDHCKGIKSFHVNTVDSAKVYTFDETDSPEDSIEDTTEIITDTDGGDESESDTEPAETTEKVIDDKNDAVADDIYENVGPEIYG